MHSYTLIAQASSGGRISHPTPISSGELWSVIILIRRTKNARAEEKMATVETVDAVDISGIVTAPDWPSSILHNSLKAHQPFSLVFCYIGIYGISLPFFQLRISIPSAYMVLCIFPLQLHLCAHLLGKTFRPRIYRI